EKQKNRIQTLENQLAQSEQKISNQRESLENHKSIIDGLQNQLKVSTLAGRLENLDTIGKATLKKQISELIKEIDATVNFLETV
ncbi:MAG TPA: hypothetical protein VGB95_00025, partial [Chitinophagales bacterium]